MSLVQRPSLTLLACAALAILAAACGSPGSEPAAVDSRSAIAQLGDKLFHDTTLSATGRMSCASCHDADRFHAAPGEDAVQAGALAGQETGRNSPMIRYLRFNKSFRFDEEGTPTGGFTWDGRDESLAAQSKGPLLAANEMANASQEDVVAKLQLSPNAEEFRRVFGLDIFNSVPLAFAKLQLALEQYQLEDPEFAPFDSKFDLVRAGKAQFTPEEQRGRELFEDPLKGNCAACHPSTSDDPKVPPLFTDFTYDNLGVPRNAAIKANANPGYYDLGLCGPLRMDLAGRDDLCGAFKVPTLRNVAKTAPYFHNGAIATLADAVRFYVTRDTDPAKWYPRRADGSVAVFNDLPPAFHGNVNTTEAPYDRRPGDAPALDEAEIALVVKFLETLTDGYVAPRP